MSNDLLYDQLLQKVLVENPELAQYAELFKQQTSSSDTSDDTKKRLQKITSIAKQMKGDLDDALDRLDELAQALGACEECWGDNNRCPTCKGDGQPGFFKPDRELFNQFILPVLNKATWLEIREK
jgi:hypothetical protein